MGEHSPPRDPAWHKDQFAVQHGTVRYRFSRRWAPASANLPSTSARNRVLTVEDMENMPDDEFRYELDDGVLIYVVTAW